MRSIGDIGSKSYLLEVHAHTTLPVLAEVLKKIKSVYKFPSNGPVRVIPSIK